MGATLREGIPDVVDILPSPLDPDPYPDHTSEGDNWTRPAPFNIDATIDALAILRTAKRAALYGPDSVYSLLWSAGNRLDAELRDYLVPRMKGAE